MRNRQQRKREAYPGLGLVIGVGLGTVVGLLFFPDVFYFGTSFGAAFGLIGGALVDLQTRR